MSALDDDALAKMLLERGLLAADEFHEAQELRKSTGKPLQQILLETSMLNPVQLQDAIASFQKRVRFCPECKGFMRAGAQAAARSRRSASARRCSSSSGGS